MNDRVRTENNQPCDTCSGTGATLGPQDIFVLYTLTVGAPEGACLAHPQGTLWPPLVALEPDQEPVRTRARLGDGEKDGYVFSHPGSERGPGGLPASQPPKAAAGSYPLPPGLVTPLSRSRTPQASDWRKLSHDSNPSPAHHPMPPTGPGPTEPIHPETPGGSSAPPAGLEPATLPIYLIKIIYTVLSLGQVLF